MANKETSGYNQSVTPITDPTHIFTGVSGATDSATPSTLTYTTATPHNFVLGQSVIIYGFANSAYNFAPDRVVNGVTTTLGAGRPAVITAVGSTTTFSVKATAQVTTTGASGYVFNDANASNSPWDTTWLPTAAAAATAANYQVGLEWGDSFALQPNDARTTAAGATDKTTASVSNTQASDVVANGSTITYTTLAAHGLVAGSRITIDGIVPAQFNYNDVIVSSAPSSTTFTVATTATGTYDYANSFGLVAPINSTGGNAQAVATSAVGPIQVGNISATSGASLITYTSVANHGLISGQYVTIAGMVPTGLNVSGVITTTAATTFTIASTANPGTSTKSGFASVQSNTYTTQQAHGLIAGQDTVVTGASLTEYNVAGRVVATASTKIASVNAAKFAGAVASTQPITVSGTAVTYVLASGHNATTSDSASVYGYVGGANLNTVGDVAISAVATNSITINTPAVTAAITSYATSGNLLTYTVPNTFKAGQVVTISGATSTGNANFNVSSVIVSATAGAFVVSGGNAVATTATITSAIGTVAATTAAVAISGVTAVAAYDTASITLTMPNNFVVGQAVTVAGLTGGTSYNTSGTVISADPSSVKIGYASTVALSGTPAVTATSNAVSVASVALPVSGSAGADAGKIGFLVKKGGTFVSPAYIGNADASWGYTGLVPSVQVNPNQDNHDIIKNSRLGYPDYFPKYTVPSVVGKTYTNAVQALTAAGFAAYSDIAPATALSVTAVATTASQVTYTVGAGHLISVGDAVLIDNKSGYTTPSTYALKTVNVVSTAATTITVNQTGVTGSYTSGDVTVTPNNAVVTAVKKVDNSTSVSAGDVFTAGTDTIAVILTHYKGL